MYVLCIYIHIHIYIYIYIIYVYICIYYIYIMFVYTHTHMCIHIQALHNAQTPMCVCVCPSVRLSVCVYIRIQVVRNAQTLSDTLTKGGCNIVSGGTGVSNVCLKCVQSVSNVWVRHRQPFNSRRSASQKTHGQRCREEFGAGRNNLQQEFHPI